MKEKNRRSLTLKLLDGIETIGNKLPHPINLFILFSIVLIVLSAILRALGISAVTDLINTSTNELETRSVEVVSLLSSNGVAYILESMVKNFTSFAPLGVVLVAMIGVGIAESSGYISAALKRAVMITPKHLVTPMVIFLGVISNVASDAGYIVLVPLGGLIFLTFKRHPLAGIAAAFAGVSGGYSANLLIGTLDPMLAGISTEAASIIDPNYIVLPTANYYFMVGSTFVVTIVGTWVTHSIIEPRLGTYENDLNESADLNVMSDLEKKALRVSNLALLLYLGAIILLAVPKDSFLRNTETKSLINNSPLMNGIVPLIMFAFLIPGLIYGKMTKSINNEKEFAHEVSKTMSSMGGYIALAFVAAQFIAYFNYTNLGTIIAVKGADFIQSIGLKGPLLFILFILIVAIINLFMGSASAKWAIMAPIFVPMFMRLGYGPEITQVAYRIGDSTTNIISPLMSYYAVIITYMHKYKRDSGIGTLISLMLPYSIAFLIGWSILLMIWMTFKLPFGIM